MKRFSQRMGIEKDKNIVQRDSMNAELRNSLWNCFLLYWFPVKHAHNDKALHRLCIRLWTDFFKWPFHTFPISNWPMSIKSIEDFFSKCEWYQVYNFIEFVSNNYIGSRRKKANQRFMECCNHIMERELSAYRFVNGIITEITSEQEIAEIEKASKVNIDPVQEHINCALRLLSNKTTPDYRNSIKESISAVEALCRSITHSKTKSLGEALDMIEREGKVKLHPALKGAFDKLYGYTSSDSGIRHALVDDSIPVGSEDARFMLISCSAFINYLREKERKKS